MWCEQFFSSVNTGICVPKRVTLWGQIFLQNFVWALSPSIIGRKKIGGFQRLTSVLWWLTTMGTKRKGGLTEKWVRLYEAWDWRRLLFEGREANPPESTGIWLCYSHGFPSLISIPLCMHWVPPFVASCTSWGEWYGQLPSALRASVTGVLEEGNEMPVCWGKTPPEEDKNLFAEVFLFIPSSLKHISSFLGNVSHIAIALRLIRLWIIVCMLIGIYWVFSLEMNKNTPTQYLQSGEKHTASLVLSSPLSQALCRLVRGCCRSTL